MADRACSLSGLANVVRTLFAKSSADGADAPLPICASRIQALITLAGGSYFPRSYRLNWDCETPRTVANSAWVRPLRAARMRSATLLTIGYLGGVNMLVKHYISNSMLVAHFLSRVSEPVARPPVARPAARESIHRPMYTVVICSRSCPNSRLIVCRATWSWPCCAGVSCCVEGPPAAGAFQPVSTR